jgi:GTP-binding protein
MQYAPVAFTSAVTGKGVQAALDTAIDAANSHAMRIPTGELNRILRNAFDARPYSEKGRNLRIYYATMAGVKPPHIVMFVNDPDLVHFSYKRYLENRIRETYSFEGTPLVIDIKRASNKKYDEA